MYAEFISFPVRSDIVCRQSKTLILSTNVDKKIVRNSVFDCHLSPGWRQMAIENTVSSDF